MVWYRLPFLFAITEKYLTAGHSGKETHCHLTTLRFMRARLLHTVDEILGEEEEQKTVTVSVGFDDWRGFVQCNEISKEKSRKHPVFLDRRLEEDLYLLVGQFNSGGRDRLGILLYGPPGNGKTSLIRAVACKYGYDVYIVVFKPNMTNEDLISLFLKLPREKRIIVVFEDFDSVFDKRQPLYGDCKFSLDGLLNLIDGLYVNTQNILFMMTANDLTKVDKAIRHRPSRFDCVVEIGNPSYENRVRILERFDLNGISERIAQLTDGQSAAVLCEIAKRPGLSAVNIEEEVRRIIDSFED